MTNANDFAYPLDTENQSNFGLTKREYFAAMAMQGMLANDWQGYGRREDECDGLARVAINFAEALIDQLNVKR